MNDVLQDTTPASTRRDALVEAILGFLISQDLLAQRDIRVALEHEIDAAGTEALIALKARLADAAGWTYYPPDPLARRIHHLLADRFLSPQSVITHSDRLAALDRRPLVLMANHLSYADANVIEVLLHRGGASAVANRLTAIAGPKVFSSRERRFSSLCFGTIKVPQSAGVSTEEAVLNAREVARAARHAIDIAQQRLQAGDALLLFGEGTRSRGAAMQSMLAGVARYLSYPDSWVVPLGLAGTEGLFPVQDNTLRAANVSLCVGRPISAAALFAAARDDRRTLMDAVGLAIADCLPTNYRGVYEESPHLQAARQVLEQAQTAAPADDAALEHEPAYTGLSHRRDDVARPL